ncbi:PadR family transcriptional regulator [Lentisphaerota bacterium WC36G]|nr:PadR family transcriptional regulator [Lentisphaerae bacterium WC36]
MSFNNWQSQMRKGLLNIIILNVLKHKRCHGYEMVKILDKTMNVSLSAGNIYPVLARMKKDNLVDSENQVSKDGPPRKYFFLTSAGEAELEKMNQHFENIFNNLESIKKGVL